MSKNEILIRISRNAGGYVFRLDPRVKPSAIPAAKKNIHVVDKLFIAYDTFHDDQDVYKDVYQQVVTLLTGLSFDEAFKLGIIRFVDSVSEKILFERSLADV